MSGYDQGCIVAVYAAKKNRVSKIRPTSKPHKYNRPIRTNGIQVGGGEMLTRRLLMYENEFVSLES